MFMMYLMGSSHSSGIPIICVPEYFETLVDKNVVHQKVRGTVSHYSKAYGVAVPKPRVGRDHDKGHANNGIEDEESVITLKPRIVIFSVVILM